MTFVRTLLAVACNALCVLAGCFLVADLFYGIIYQDWFVTATLGITAIVVIGFLQGVSLMFGYAPECFTHVPGVCKWYRVFLVITILLWLVPGLSVTHLYPDAELAILVSGYTSEDLYVLRLFPGCYVHYVFSLTVPYSNTSDIEVFYKVGLLLVGLMSVLTGILALGTERVKATTTREAVVDEE